MKLIIVLTYIGHLVLQHSSSDQLKHLWEEYDKIQIVIERLSDLQGHESCVLSRTEKFPCFKKWLQENGASCFDNVSVEVVIC
jgi:hypothetical protein